jgi:hypothetical protein
MAGNKPTIIMRAIIIASTLTVIRFALFFITQILSFFERVAHFIFVVIRQQRNTRSRPKDVF